MEISAFFSQKTVVVTGGAGFLGSNLCSTLLQLGAKVIAIDNLLTGHQKNLAELEANPNFSFINADVNQPTETYLPTEQPIDLILHFASPASPPRYQQFPVETYLVNSLGTHHLLQFLKKHHPKAHFLFAGTSELYGDPERHPQSESYWGNVNPNGPRSCYDESKRLGETICGVHYRDFHMDVRIVRIFNTYGPKMDPADGRVIPDFIHNALQSTPLVIHGDGQQTRSYCFVDDLIEGILRLAAAENLAGETLNIGNPGEFSIMKTAEVIFETVTGQAFKPELHATFKPLPQDDPLRRQPDISKAKKLLDWTPKVSFEEGIRKTIEYFRNYA
jgi:nucleoside-diphosphate-sugar epimerase